jgi:pimeloyl-ACP methyl ester carboxylesterase
VLLQKPSLRLVQTGLVLAKEWRDADPARKIDEPVLVLVAECDQIMDNESACTVARLHAKKVTMETLPGAGHGAQISHAHLVAEQIRNWVGRVH